MRRFRFRLQAVLGLRDLEEQQARVALGVSHRRLAREAAQLQALESDSGAHTDLRARRRTEGAPPAQIIRLDAYGDALRQAIFEQMQRVIQAEDDVAASRDALRVAMQRREILSKLRDRRRAEHYQAGLAEEQKALDDFAAVRFAAGKRATSP